MQRAEHRRLSGADVPVEPNAPPRARLAVPRLPQAAAVLTALLMLATACSRNAPPAEAEGNRYNSRMNAKTEGNGYHSRVKGTGEGDGYDSATKGRAEGSVHEPVLDSRVSQQLARGAAGIHNGTIDVSKSGAPSGRKTAYLTFDDGPSASTKRILAILSRYGVKATFFVVGTTSEEGKELYRRILREGHRIGNHTFSHDYSSVYRSQEAFRNDVDKLNRLLEETTGQVPDILRYPGGSNNKLGRKFGGPGIMSSIVRDMRESGYEFFDWNVSSTDAAAPVQERDVIVGSVLEAARGKRDAIVLMHDNTRKTTTVEALPAVIEGLKGQGFSFDVLRMSSFSFHFLEVN